MTFMLLSDERVLGNPVAPPRGSLRANEWLELDPWLWRNRAAPGIRYLTANIDEETTNSRRRSDSVMIATQS